LYKDDIDRAIDLNMNMFRLSIEWSRLVKNEGDSFDVDVVNTYRDMLSYMKDKGLTTNVTLFHFTVPMW